MDGDEGRIGDEVAVGGEEGAGEVEALLQPRTMSNAKPQVTIEYFDIGRYSSLLQCTAHGLRYRHESVRKEGEQDWVCIAGHIDDAQSGRRARCGNAERNSATRAFVIGAHSHVPRHAQANTETPSSPQNSIPTR